MTVNLSSLWQLPPASAGRSVSPETVQGDTCAYCSLRFKVSDGEHSWNGDVRIVSASEERNSASVVVLIPSSRANAKLVRARKNCC